MEECKVTFLVEILMYIQVTDELLDKYISDDVKEMEEVVALDILIMY